MPGMEAYMALPWVFDYFLRKSGGTMTGALTLSDGSAAEGAVASKGNYVRYASGLQICWGYVDINGPVTATNKRITFPAAFITSPAILTTYSANIGNTPIGFGWESTTAFSIGTIDGSKITGLHTTWIAIGTWK